MVTKWDNTLGTKVMFCVIAVLDAIVGFPTVEIYKHPKCMLFVFVILL